MGVRDALAKIEASYISLDEVLRRIAAAEGVTYKDAARALMHWLGELQFDMPSIQARRVIGGDHATMTERARFEACLGWAAVHGEPDDDSIPF